MHPPEALWWESPSDCLERVGTEAAIFLPFSFLIGDQASGWCSSQGCQGIVDTGTSLLVMPAQYLSELLQTIGAQEGEYGVSLGKGLSSSGEAILLCVCVCLCLALPFFPTENETGGKRQTVGFNSLGCDWMVTQLLVMCKALDSVSGNRK